MSGMHSTFNTRNRGKIDEVDMTERPQLCMVPFDS